MRTKNDNYQNNAAHQDASLVRMIPAYLWSDSHYFNDQLKPHYRPLLAAEDMSEVKFLLSHTRVKDGVQDHGKPYVQWVCVVLRFPHLIIDDLVELTASLKLSPSTALECAASTGMSGYVAHLLLSKDKEGKPVIDPDNDYDALRNAFSSACKRGDKDLAKRILKHFSIRKADFDAAFTDNCQYNGGSMFDWFFKHAQDRTATLLKDDGYWAFNVACINGDKQLAVKLFGHIQPCDIDDAMEALHKNDLKDMCKDSCFEVLDWIWSYYVGKPDLAGSFFRTVLEQSICEQQEKIFLWAITRVEQPLLDTVMQENECLLLKRLCATGNEKMVNGFFKLERPDNQILTAGEHRPFITICQSGNLTLAKDFLRNAYQGNVRDATVFYRAKSAAVQAGHMDVGVWLVDEIHKLTGAWAVQAGHMDVGVCLDNVRVGKDMQQGDVQIARQYPPSSYNPRQFSGSSSGVSMDVSEPGFSNSSARNL